MAPKVWVTAHSREEGPAASVGNQQVKAKAGSHIAPHLRVCRLCWRWRREPLGSELLCAPEWGIVSETTACVGRRHPSCSPHSHSEARAQA